MTPKQKILLNQIGIVGQLRLKLAGTMIHYDGDVHYKVLYSCLEAGWIEEKTPPNLQHRFAIYTLTRKGKLKMGMEIKVSVKKAKGDPYE